MQGAVNLGKYLEEKDKNGVKVSSWAVQIAPGVAECRVCVPTRRIQFKKGKNELKLDILRLRNIVSV